MCPRTLGEHPREIETRGIEAATRGDEAFWPRGVGGGGLGEPENYTFATRQHVL